MPSLEQETTATRGGPCRSNIFKICIVHLKKRQVWHLQDFAHHVCLNSGDISVGQALEGCTCKRSRGQAPVFFGVETGYESKEVL